MASVRLAVFVGTEIAAGVTTMAIQQAQGAPIREIIISAAAVVAALGVLWGVVRFFLKPLLHNWLYAVFAHEHRRTAELVIDALDATDSTRGMFRGYTDRVYHDKIASDQETRDMAEQTKDELVFLKESNSLQGAALTKEIARAMEHMARSTDQQTRIMEKIQKELEDHSIIIARLDERVRGWDGRERRTTPRGEQR